MEKDPGRGGNTLLEEKKETLYRAMYSAQPSFDDFKGYTGYSNGMLRSDKEWLDEKSASIYNSEWKDADDDFARYMEPVVTYILNREELLPTRDNFAFLASEYDDKRNGTDIVFGVENNEFENDTIVSIDVATGTLLDNIAKKFANSFDKHNGTAYIKYCMHNEKRWREPDALHFVIGMSPASQNKAFDKINVANGELKGRETDFDSDFIILSEMREQIRMQLADLKRRPADEIVEQRKAKLDDLAAPINTGICRTLGINFAEYPTKEERNRVFRERYLEKQRELSKIDAVYKNIIGLAIDRTRGAKIL